VEISCLAPYKIDAQAVICATDREFEELALILAKGTPAATKVSRICSLALWDEEFTSPGKEEQHTNRKARHESARPLPLAQCR
jgi:hypothetical protein